MAWRKIEEEEYGIYHILLTDSVGLALENRCVTFIWSNLNSSSAVVKNVYLFHNNKDSIIGNHFRYFSYKYKVYRNNWFSKLMT